MPSLWDKFKDKLEERLNWDTFKEEAFQSPISPAPLGLVGLSSNLPKFYRLAGEVSFQDRDAIAKAVPGLIRRLAQNKMYDYSSAEEIANSIRELAKLPSRHGSNTRFIDRVKGLKDLETDYIRKAMQPEIPPDIASTRMLMRGIRGGQKAVEFGSDTSATNLYAALINTLERQGFSRPYNIARQLLYHAGFTGGIK